MLLATGLLAWTLLPGTPARAGSFPATGQTTSYQADKNDGIAGPVDVPDDGALQRGRTLRYKDLKDGTVKDQNTGLIWEVKCSSCGGLHDVDNVYPWYGDGSTDTIWDWLDDINAESGKGYAEHHDWRIPNRRELESLVDAELPSPSIDPIFGPTAVFNTYWSSTTLANGPFNAWGVGFYYGDVTAFDKSFALAVRAVRGGPK